LNGRIEGRKAVNYVNYVLWHMKHALSFKWSRGKAFFVIVAVSDD